MTWQEICADPILVELPYRIESDRWGNVVMSPPPGAAHSDYQSQIHLLLARLMTPEGYPRTECPLQTTDGVKGIDVVWMSPERRAQKPKKRDLYLMAPEICVEVISPKIKRGEIEEKRRLYFEKGAVECWTCDGSGKMAFHDVTGPIPHSRLCPDFPARLEIAD